MSEHQPCGVQEMTLRREIHELSASAATVRIVTDHGVADRGEVHADLMCAAREEMRSQQVAGIESRESHERRLGGLAAGHDRHALAVARVARDRLVDGDLIVVEMAPAERGVPPRDLP